MPGQWVTRNHYNPCFWTAYWNPSYYAAATEGRALRGSAREQTVYSLNVKADRILTTTVGNVHYDKGLGPAEISREAAEDFVQRHWPERFEKFCRESATAHYPVFINLEQVLSALESLEHYDTLRAVIARQDIASPMEKWAIACVVYLQALRCHGIMNSLIEWHETLGVKKFEFFMSLKAQLSDPDLLATMIGPLVHSHWVLYRTAVPTFPLTDSPVLVARASIMMALSPRLLLEIARGRPAGESQWQTRRGIKRGKLAEFRCRTIGNTFREIIFGDKATLEVWQATSQFRRRAALMAEMTSYNERVKTDGEAELWLVNAFGNRV